MTPTPAPALDPLDHAAGLHTGHLLLRAERNRCIRQAHADGVTRAEIARRVGLAATAVKRVLDATGDDQ